MNTNSMFKSKPYLDQNPELEQTIKSWLETLDLDSGICGVAYDDPTINAIECRSRDGFIANSHNCGGFDLEYSSDVSHCNGTGSGPNLKGIDRVVEWAYEASKKQFMEDHAEELKGIPESQIHYHGLYELGLGTLAESLSETENSYLECPVRWGVRTMYEGIESDGTHTLMIYASGNVEEYYNFAGKNSETLCEFEVKFKSISQLRRKLLSLTRKIESAF